MDQALELWKGRNHLNAKSILALYVANAVVQGSGENFGCYYLVSHCYSASAAGHYAKEATFFNSLATDYLDDFFR